MPHPDFLPAPIARLTIQPLDREHPPLAFLPQALPGRPHEVATALGLEIAYGELWPETALHVEATYESGHGCTWTSTAWFELEQLSRHVLRREPLRLHRLHADMFRVGRVEIVLVADTAVTVPAGFPTDYLGAHPRKALAKAHEMIADLFEQDRDFARDLLRTATGPHGHRGLPVPEEHIPARALFQHYAWPALPDDALEHVRLFVTSSPAALIT